MRYNALIIDELLNCVSDGYKVFIPVGAFRREAEITVVRFMTALQLTESDCTKLHKYWVKIAINLGVWAGWILAKNKIWYVHRLCRVYAWYNDVNGNGYTGCIKTNDTFMK